MAGSSGSSGICRTISCSDAFPFPQQKEKGIEMPVYNKETIADLIDGKLSWTTLKSMMSSDKDSDRFEKYREILQERVRGK